MDIELIETGDGSHSLFLPEMDETYHSKKGALTESEYVYIKMGLSKIKAEPIHILEFGFGTGLNAFLSAEYAKAENKKIRYISSEKFPLDKDIYSQLNYGHPNPILWKKLHEVDWEGFQSISSNFDLLKSQGDFLSIDCSTESIDLVYYDAFAPSKQAEVWAIPYLEKVYSVLKPGGIMVSYCAQGQFKRNLRSLGFAVESLQGPPGKLEMIRAQKPEN